MTNKANKPNRYVSLDEEIYEALRESAQANMRSIKGQTHWIIRDFFNRKNNAI